MNREVDSNRHSSGLWWLPRALHLKARRRWRNWWRWVCERSPGLCLSLESARKTVFRFDPEVLEVQIAALSLSAAVRLMFRALGASGHTFEDTLLTNLLPFWAWAALFGGMGVGHLVALAMRRLEWRATGAMLGVLAWSFVSVLMLLDGLASPGTVLFPVVALSEAWVYLRLTTCCFDAGSPSIADELVDESDGES